MKFEDFNNIDLKTAGNLPMPVKAVLLGVLLLLILLAGYWFLWSNSMEELEQARSREEELRQTYIAKKVQATNLSAYQQQMVDIEKTFGALLRQLPDRSQIDGLLTDINQVGLERGLEFELFKPGQEIIADFYAELPISIKVTGSYHDLGAFAASIAKLPRIVTLNDLSITTVNKDDKESLLTMEAVARTYRYLDAGEVTGKKTAGAAAKKQQG